MDESKHEDIEWCGGIYQKDHLWQFIKESSGQSDFKSGWTDWTRRHYSCQYCRKYDIVDTYVHHKLSTIG